jgi:hypothetical protein
LSPAIFDGKILFLNKAEFAQSAVQSGDSLPRKPIIDFGGRCARLLTDQTAAVPPISIMNSRRRILPPPGSKTLELFQASMAG